MKKLLILLLLITGCAAPNKAAEPWWKAGSRTVTVTTPEAIGSGYLIRPGEVITVEHVVEPLVIGDTVVVESGYHNIATMGTVVEVSFGWAVIKTLHPIRKGDSGGPVFKDGKWVASIESLNRE